MQLNLCHQNIKKNGVITHSSGNFAQGLACASSLQDINAFIVMPDNAPRIKKDSVLKYDVNLMLRYGLAKQDQWKINGKSCIELNSAWIGFEIMDKIQPKFKIIFRDSCRILPMSLEKLCEELDVKLNKLKETVNHDPITGDNYMTFPQLPKYLTHDVFGLLESMLKFNKQVYEDLEIDVTKCYTGASLSKSNFFTVACPCCCSHHNCSESRLSRSGLRTAVLRRQW